MTNHLNEVSDSRGSRYVEKTFYEIAEAMGYDKVRVAIAQFHQMMHDMELDNPKAINKEEELSLLVKSVNPVRLKNNPISLSSETILALYDIIVL